MKYSLIALIFFVFIMPCFAYANGRTEIYDDAYKYRTGDVDIPGRVEELEIHWTAGDVNITVYDGDRIAINTDNPDMHWLYEGRELEIRFAQSGAKEKSKIVRYNLDIKIPDKKMESFSLENGIGDVKINLPECREVDIESGVGNSEVVLASIPEEMDIKIGNGDLNLTFPKEKRIKIEAPFGIGGRDIAQGIEVVKDSDLEIEMGVGNLTVSQKQ